MNRRIRPLLASDREGVIRILENAGNFTVAEVTTALELVDEWIELGEESGYLTYVLESIADGTGVLGYVCFGPAPLTEWTYDLYWIAVDKSKHRGGVGKRLMKFAEEEVERRGGRLLLIETSSQETYGGTIQFYERTGYQMVGKITDYYKAGDDKLIFAKRLRPAVTIETARTDAMNGESARVEASGATPDQRVGSQPLVIPMQR